MTIRFCPRCGGAIDRPALSRADNETYICSACGTAEAMFNFHHPELELPPVDQLLPREGWA